MFDTFGYGDTLSSSTTMSIDITTATVGAEVFLWLQWGLQNATFSIPGWTEVAKASTSSTLTGGFFHRKKQAGDTTFTATMGSAKGAHQWVSYTGLDATTPYQSASNSNLLARNSSSNLVNTPSIASTSAAALPLALFCTRTSTSAQKNLTFTEASGLTERVEHNNSAAPSSVWVSGSINEGAAIGDTSSHSYQVTASSSQSYAIGGLFYLNPQVVAEEAGFVGWGIPL